MNSETQTKRSEPNTPTRWLIMRGLAREQRHFENFPAIFAQRLGVQTVGIDFPGFGTESKRTSPTTIKAITDDTRARFMAMRGADTWGILAISLGGMITLDWLARYPQDFTRGVVINTSAADTSLPWQRFQPRVWPGVLKSTLGGPVTREQTVIAMTMNVNQLDKRALAEKWVGYFVERQPERRNFLRQLYAGARSKLPSSLSVPTLVLASTGDRLCSYRCSENIAARLQLPLRLQQGGGHDLTNDDPVWVSETVAAWLAEST